MSEGNGMAEGQTTIATKKGNARLSKEKYYKVKEMLKLEVGEENLERVMIKFQEIMNFDPKVTTYSQEMKDAVYKYRNKKAEEMGTSVYKAFNLGKYYKKKEKSEKEIA